MSATQRGIKELDPTKYRSEAAEGLSGEASTAGTMRARVMQDYANFYTKLFK